MFRQLALSIAMSSLALGCDTRRSVAPQSATTLPSNTPPAYALFGRTEDGKRRKLDEPILITLHERGVTIEESKCPAFPYLGVAGPRVFSISLSGTIPLAGGGYQWSGDTAENFQRIYQVFEDVDRHWDFQRSGIVLLGCGQGAYAAMGLAYEYPEVFAGAIAIAPEHDASLPFTPTPSPLLAKRGFVLCYGEADDATQTQRGLQRLEAIRKTGAKVRTAVYPVATDTMLKSLSVMIPGWFEFVSTANEK